MTEDSVKKRRKKRLSLSDDEFDCWNKSDGKPATTNAAAKDVKVHPSVMEECGTKSLTGSKNVVDNDYGKTLQRGVTKII